MGEFGITIQHQLHTNCFVRMTLARRDFMVFQTGFTKFHKVCKSCRSGQELSNKYFLFTCKHRLRYSRERAVQNLLISHTYHPDKVKCTWRTFFLGRYFGKSVLSFIDAGRSDRTLIPKRTSSSSSTIFSNWSETYDVLVCKNRKKKTMRTSKPSKINSD